MYLYLALPQDENGTTQKAALTVLYTYIYYADHFVRGVRLRSGH